MDNWIWTINDYFNPENAVKKPLKEQWIFLYSGKKENDNPYIFQEETEKYSNKNNNITK